MIERIKLKSAFKHGGYSALSVLPGEDRAAFERLLEELQVEYQPSGPLEQHVLQDLAHLIWRRANLAILQAAKRARTPLVRDRDEFSGYTYTMKSPDLEQLQATECADRLKSQEDSFRKQLGTAYELVAVGEIATIGFLERELKLMERMDDMIDRCVKRLLHAKALKSISVSSSSPAAAAAPPKKVLPAA